HPPLHSFPTRRSSDLGVKTVTGFTGSSIWHALYAFPPTSQTYIERGFEDFAARWRPILDAFDDAGVDFALEVHPTEIAFDTASRSEEHTSELQSQSNL